MLHVLYLSGPLCHTSTGILYPQQPASPSLLLLPGCIVKHIFSGLSTETSERVVK